MFMIPNKGFFVLLTKIPNILNHEYCKYFGRDQIGGIIIFYLSLCTLLGIYPKDTDAVKRRDTCTPDVSSSNVHNSQTVEGASVSIER